MHPLFSPEIAHELVADRVRSAERSRRVRRRRERPSRLRRRAGAALVGAGHRPAGGPDATAHSFLRGPRGSSSEVLQ